jgi:hypothetical protein
MSQLEIVSGNRNHIGKEYVQFWSIGSCLHQGLRRSNNANSLFEFQQRLERFQCVQLESRNCLTDRVNHDTKRASHHHGLLNNIDWNVSIENTACNLKGMNACVLP